MRILFVLNNFAPTYFGGAEIALYHTCRSLIESGLECSILVVSNTRASALAEEFYEYDGIPVHWPRVRVGPSPRWQEVFDREIYRAVRDEIKRVRPDVVHIHNISGAGLAPAVACRAAGVPVVQTLHDFGMLCPNNMRYQVDGAYCDPAHFRESCQRCYRQYDYWADVPMRTTVFKALSSNVKFFISPSKALAAQYVRAGYDERRFRVVPNGIGPWADFELANPRVQAAISASVGRPTLLFGAGGFETKGPAVLLDALPVMQRHIEGLRLIVTGGGDPRLLELFRRAGAETLGYVPFDCMPALTAAADLTVVPSLWFDNAPMVIAESLRFGTPVVAANVGGIPEMIKDFQTGYLFPRGDAVALAERIVFHFSRSSFDRRQMSRDCIIAGRAYSSIERHVDGLCRVYEDAVGY